jgi:uncharacterized alkaline shock family protein YloU
LSNDANRMLIVLAAAGMIVVMALLIFITWSADTDAIDSLGDLVEYLDDHNDSAGKLIITLAALIVVVLSLLMIVVELAPEDEQRELRVKQEGATTIVPAAALRARIEEALVALPDVTAAKARVNSRDKGIATSLDLTLTPGANISEVTQNATRIVTDTVQSDLGLPVAGQPSVRVSFGGPKVASPAQPAASAAPVVAATEPALSAAGAAPPTGAEETAAADQQEPSTALPADPASEPPSWAPDEPAAEPAEGDASGSGPDVPRDPPPQP